MIRVVLADDQAIVRAGLVMLLAAAGDIEVVAEATNGQEAINLADLHKPDVVVMDIRMPKVDGVQATQILTSDPGRGVDHLTKVLVLTTFDDDEAVYGALRAGASGFLLKYAAPQVLVEAIRKVAAGGAWIDQDVATQVISCLAQTPHRGVPDSDLIERLTDRERQVLELMAHGQSNREISDQLVLSEATVKTHVSRILMKTASHDRAQAVALAYQSGLVQVGRAPRHD